MKSAELVGHLEAFSALNAVLGECGDAFSGLNVVSQARAGSVSSLRLRRMVWTTKRVIPRAASAPPDPIKATVTGVQSRLFGGGMSDGRFSAWAGGMFSSDGTVAVNAAIGSMTPYPTKLSRPPVAGGCCAVNLIRCITS